MDEEEENYTKLCILCGGIIVKPQFQYHLKVRRLLPISRRGIGSSMRKQTWCFGDLKFYLGEYFTRPPCAASLLPEFVEFVRI
jgi:hypothetical protein